MIKKLKALVKFKPKYRYRQRKKTQSRWSRLWNAVKRWWLNEEPPVLDLTPITHVRKLLMDYDDLYRQRAGIDVPGFASQAADIVEREGHKRAPGLESEVRVLAIAVERLLAQMELDLQQRQLEREL
jgi:hypothetical protein